MARFLLVLQPRCPAETNQRHGQETPCGSVAILQSLEPVLRDLGVEVDHRTTSHLGALLRQGGDSQRMQLFADVQSKPGGRKTLELVLLSRESMGLGAPQTLAVLERLVALCQQHLEEMHLVFRSDRDGPLPRDGSGSTT
jgi:hypothetical protein